MTILKQALLLSAIAGLAACQKTNTIDHNHTTQIGVLEAQGMTTYQYGTHTLAVNPYTTFVLKSSTINLNTYLGRRVQVTAINTHTHVEGGPDLYDVTAVVPQ